MTGGGQRAGGRRSNYFRKRIGGKKKRTNWGFGGNVLVREVRARGGQDRTRPLKEGGRRITTDLKEETRGYNLFHSWRGGGYRGDKTDKKGSKGILRKKKRGRPPETGAGMGWGKGGQENTKFSLVEILYGVWDLEEISVIKRKEEGCSNQNIKLPSGSQMGRRGCIKGGKMSVLGLDLAGECLPKKETRLTYLWGKAA